MNSYQISQWMREHAAVLAEFELPATERTVTQLGMTRRMTEEGYTEVDPFDQVECGLDSSPEDTPWVCLDLPPLIVESFDYL